MVAQNGTAFWLRGGGKLGKGQLQRQWDRNMKVNAPRFPAVLLRVRKASIRSPTARVYSNVKKRWPDTIVGQQKRGSIRRGGRGLTPKLAGGIFIPFKHVPRTPTGRIAKATLRNAVVVTSKKRGAKYVVDNKAKSRQRRVLGSFKSSVRIPRRYRVEIPYSKANPYYRKLLIKEHRRELRKIAARSRR